MCSRRESTKWREKIVHMVSIRLTLKSAVPIHVTSLQGKQTAKSRCKGVRAWLTDWQGTVATKNAKKPAGDSPEWCSCACVLGEPRRLREREGVEHQGPQSLARNPPVLTDDHVGDNVTPTLQKGG